MPTKVFKKRKLVDLLTNQAISKKELEVALEKELAQQQEVDNLHIVDRRLKTAGELTALNWQARQTYDGNGVTSIDWHSRRLLDEQPVDSLHWFNRTLGDAGGNVVANWSNGFRTRAGTTATRLSLFSLDPSDAGVQFFDTDLGIPVWWDGTQWVNSLGTPV
jgi:hypothetical protein